MCVLLEFTLAVQFKTGCMKNW